MFSHHTSKIMSEHLDVLILQLSFISLLPSYHFRGDGHTTRLNFLHTSSKEISREIVHHQSLSQNLILSDLVLTTNLC